jgi:hypothetical protein
MFRDATRSQARGGRDVVGGVSTRRRSAPPAKAGRPLELGRYAGARSTGLRSKTACDRASKSAAAAAPDHPFAALHTDASTEILGKPLNYSEAELTPF